jgi:DMSO/TMAO reductase YedYZ heme-binding membrane subunit
VTSLIVVALIINFGLAGLNAPAIKDAIDATGRSSLILFSIAFTCSSIESLWPSSLARWTLRNRRWIGLSFASSHFIHLGLIVSMTVLFPDPFVSEQSMAQWVFGGLAYGFVFLMALTSTDQAQRWMGMKNWKRLHFVGSHWIWTLFLLTYVKHVKEGPLCFYLPFLVFTLALIPMRYAKHHTPPKAPTGALI